MTVKRNKKILVSARDPGAAGNLAIVAQMIQDDGNLEQTICAAPPADEIFARHGLRVHHTITGGLNTNELLTSAERVLATVSPDILLVGLSGPDSGIDEALLKSAHGIPRFAFQDFWGDVNLSLGRAADLYLVQDQLAAEITTKRYGLACEVVGLPKYIPYQQLNPGTLQQKMRKMLGIGHDTPVAGFCGQPLWQQPGYRETVKVFLDCISGLPEYHLIFRPHPKEDQQDIEEFSAMVQDSGGTCQVEMGENTEPFLACCDIVVSAFSNCGLDLAYLNRLPGSPGGVPVYLMVEPRLCALYREWTGLTSLPLVDMRLALSASSQQQLSSVLSQTLSHDKRQVIIANAERLLPDPAASGVSILRLLKDSLKNNFAF